MRHCLHCAGRVTLRGPRARHAAVGASGPLAPVLPVPSLRIHARARGISNSAVLLARPKPGQVKPGPLPTDPFADLAPPQRGVEVPPFTPRERSAILEDEYLDRPKWKADPLQPSSTELRQSPYGYMSATFSRLCSVSKKYLPKSFMLKLKAARINDEGGVMLFPDDVQHPKYVPRKTGMSMYCALHPTAVKALTNKAGPHSYYKFNIHPAATIPANLPEIVDDMLGKRVVQELEVLRKVIRAIPRAQSQTPFIRPLSDAEADAIRAGMLPEYADADVVGIIDTDLRDPILPTRLARSSDAKGDADVIVFPLRLASHAPQAGALLRSIIAMEEQRAMAGDMRRAEEDMKDSVAARAAAEGVSKYEAGTETVADLKGTLPSEEVKASDRGVEIHREGEGARFVAIVVPNAASGVDELWRAAAVPFVISLIRVGLFNGFGWEETPVASK